MTTTNPFDIEPLRKIFVGGLNRATTDEGMKEFFSKYGSIVDSVVICGTENKGSRGFGYVTYESSDMVDAVLADRPHVIDGKEVEVKRAIPRDENNSLSHTKTTKIFIGGLPKDTTEDDIHNYFSNPDLKVSVTSVEMMMKDGESRGFCFVSFTNEDMVDKLTIIKHHNIKGGKKSEVKKAHPKNSEGGGQGGSRGGPRGGPRGGRGRGRGGYQGYRPGGGAGADQYGGSGYNNGDMGYGGGGMGYGSGYGGSYGSSFGGDSGYGGGYGGDFQMGYYNQGPSSYGPSRGRGRGRGGNTYTPY